jgi:hypothetical protein
MAVNYGLKLHPNSLDIKIKKLEILLEWEEYNTAKELIDELKGSSMENTDFLVCYAKYYSNLGNPKNPLKFVKSFDIRGRRKLPSTTLLRMNM